MRALFIGMNTGVYKIVNSTNDKCYIGSTATLGFKKRWWSHRTKLRMNKHFNQHLQYSWNKYGEQNFRFEIVERCLPAQCIAREQYYFDSLHPEYNILQIAGSCRGYKHTDIAKKKIGVRIANILNLRRTSLAIRNSRTKTRQTLTAKTS